MKQLKLSLDIIYNKEFDTELNGYNCDEVDTFLDEVLQDYQTFEEKTQELLNQIADLTAQVNELNKKNFELSSKSKLIDLSNTTTYSSVDILKRIRRIEDKLEKLDT